LIALVPVIYSWRNISCPRRRMIVLLAFCLQSEATIEAAVIYVLGYYDASRDGYGSCIHSKDGNYWHL